MIIADLHFKGLLWLLGACRTGGKCKETSEKAIVMNQGRDDGDLDQSGVSGAVRSGRIMPVL